MPGPVVLRTFSPARAWRPAVSDRLARTLGPERLPVHRGFAQDRQSMILDCNSRGSHRSGRQAATQGISCALRWTPLEYECLAGYPHFNLHSQRSPLSGPLKFDTFKPSAHAVRLIWCLRSITWRAGMVALIKVV